MLRANIGSMPPGTDVERGTKQRLLDAAVQCIHDKGYGATTARDIAALSGANLASIGYHFGSKDDLLDQALIVATEDWLAPLLDPPPKVSTGTPRERLIRALTAYLDSLVANRQLNIAFIEAMARMERAAPLRAELVDCYDRLRHALATGALRHVGDDVDATGLASIIIALHDGLMVQYLIDPTRPVDVAAMIDGLAGIVAI